MLPDEERARVLAEFPPAYALIKATHVTLSIDVKEIPQDAEIVIVGYATDQAGVEALVVTVNGEETRPDGKQFHLTLSVADGRASKESNEVIMEYGWTLLETPFPIRTKGFLYGGTGYITTALSA